MAYLSLNDFTARISLDHLAEILTQAGATSGLTNDQIRINAQNQALAEIRSYLVSKYNITAELALDSSSGARNTMIMQWAMDIALYNIHFTVNPRDIPAIREKAYKAAIEGLKAARDADIVLEIAQNDPFYTRHLIGSNVNKFVSHEFTDPTLFPNCP